MPSQWSSFNAMPDTDAYTGTYAAKIRAKRSPNGIVETGTGLVLGTYSRNPTGQYLVGQPFHYNIPGAITFYYKFVPGHPSDYVYVNALAIKYDSTNAILGGIHARADEYISTQQNGYRKFTAPLYRGSGETMCDTLALFFHYRTLDTSAQPTGYVLIDHIEVEYPQSVVTAALPEVVVSPNPASDWIRLTGIPDGFPYDITDLMGRKVLSGFTSVKPLSVAGLPVGSYLLRLRGSERAVTSKILIMR